MNPYLKLPVQPIRLLDVTSLHRFIFRPELYFSMSAAVLLTALLCQPLSLEAQNSGKAMSKNDVIGLLEGGVEPAKVGEAAELVGITFEMNSQAETELRDVGADNGLIALLKRIAPKSSATKQPKPPPGPSGPAVLMVEVMPGGAQVYVDDEPVGTTSQAGRLKLSQLQPGEHSVRVSLAGYADYESRVELKLGETAQVSAALQNASAPGGRNPLAPSNPPAGGGGGTNPLAGGGATGGSGSSAEPGSLGVMVASQTPAGGRGAYITAVTPGSPAAQAGLRPGHTILTVNGQSINAPQGLLDIITRAHAGDYLQIAYNDGSRVQWTRAQLVPRSSLSAPSQPQPSAGGGIAGVVPSPGATQPQIVQPTMPPVAFAASHDHGQSGQDYCTGVLTVGGGRITFRGNNPAHVFNFGVDEVKEAKKNGVYLAMLGAFHIRLKSGPNYNFVLLNASGQHQPPDEFLRAIGMAMGK